MPQYIPNSEQQQIINHINGAILVLAPVGTGKTHVLSERVIQAIKNGIPAEKILCLTFTNRAAIEMSERLAQSCPNEFHRITIKTFHSLCTLMLRLEARKIGLPADFVVYDETDCKDLIKEIFNLSKDNEAQEILSRLANCKIKVSVEKLSLSYPHLKLFKALGSSEAQLASHYQATLRERHALDFADLIFYVRSMFSEDGEIKKRWGNRYDFIQVDEVQDTHLSEYEIIHCLASRTRNVAMIGDLDQTIYEWRGSEPERVIGQFQQDFSPQEYSLTYNYRATKMLLKASSAFAESFGRRYTNIIPAPTCETGELIQFHVAKNEWEEAKWIGAQIQKLTNNNPNFAYDRVAVLTRNHKRIEVIASTLEKLNVPCITIEQHQFFMRQEIKDALAYLRLVINPFDTGAMRRMLLRPSRGIGSITIKNLIEEAKDCGLRLTDMASTQTFVYGEPFNNLLTAYEDGTIVVFDVETTGLDVSKDEVIEIAAVRLVKGEKQSEFHAYIANTVPVGDSNQIHGVSDKFLAANGKKAGEVFCEFFHFTKDALLVGHNVGFDIKMVTAHAHKVGVNIPKFQWTDTWNLANRFIESDSYSLETLAKILKLPQLPSHRALNDTLTTIELLAVLIPYIKLQADARRTLVSRYQEKFESLAQQIEIWRDAHTRFRPAYLLSKILVESGLYDYYLHENKKRLQNLKRLMKIFQEQDEEPLHSETALRNIIEYTALAKNIDRLSQDNNQVSIITVHQSKGLEFDTIFMAGLSEGEFPSFFSRRDGKVEEEKRLFYVAMTRAKRRLFISAFLKDSQGYSKLPSQFIKAIPPNTLNQLDI